MLHKKILYIGPLNKNGTCYQRLITFERIFLKVIKIDTYVYKHNTLVFYLNAILNKFNIWLDFVNANNLIAKQNETYDIIWIDKGLTIKKISLKSLKKNINTKIIHYSPDDMINPKNQSYRFLRSLSFYDLHVTTKSYNVTELISMGAKNAVFINNCFDDIYHIKIQKLNQDFDIGFIGSFEIERANMLLILAIKKYNLAIRGNWPKKWVKIFQKYSIDIKPIELSYPEYNLFISNCKINLCFLRKVNRDLQTTRSIEIPAMGGFMLAEDTVEHRLLFESEKEAVFFKNEFDFEEKINYYINESNLRIQIADNGYKKTLNSGYSNFNTFYKLFNDILFI